MLGLLLSLLVLVIVVYVAKLVLDSLPLPPPIKTIAYLIVGLVGLIWLLRQLGLSTGILRW